VTCADAPEGQRRQFLRDALARVLKGMPEARRESSLATLAEHFPSWGGVPVAAAPAESLSAEQMVSRLVALAPQMTPESRARLSQQLQAAGLLPARRSEQSGEAFDDLRGRHGLARPPDLDRAASLLSLLADLVQKLDEVACKTAKKLPPPPDTPALVIRTLDAQELHEAIGGFLAAEDAATADKLKEVLVKLLEKHRKLMVALMANSVGVAGAPSTGTEFAKWFLEMFKPERIEEATKSQDSSYFAAVGLDVFLEKRCWKKFGERFEELANQRYVDQKVQEAAANAAERIFQLKI